MEEYASLPGAVRDNESCANRIWKLRHEGVALADEELHAHSRVMPRLPRVTAPERGGIAQARASSILPLGLRKSLVSVPRPSHRSHRTADLDQ